jgi:hypothetical protein
MRLEARLTAEFYLCCLKRLPVFVKEVIKEFAIENNTVCSSSVIQTTQSVKKEKEDHE